jgi:hypothetical protein
LVQKEVDGTSDVADSGHREGAFGKMLWQIEGKDGEGSHEGTAPIGRIGDDEARTQDHMGKAGTADRRLCRPLAPAELRPIILRRAGDRDVDEKRRTPVLCAKSFDEACHEIEIGGRGG